MNTLEILNTDTSAGEEVDDAFLENVARLCFGTILALFDCALYFVGAGVFRMLCVTILRFEIVVEMLVDVVLDSSVMNRYDVGQLTHMGCICLTGLFNVQCIQAWTATRVLQCLFGVFLGLSMLVLALKSLSFFLVVLLA